MSFPCTRCGLCCQNIDKVEQLSSYHNGNGICFYYDSEIGCKIYENRPDACRIDDAYSKYFSELISFEDYYQKNAEICNQLQEEKQMEEKFRVIL